MPTLSRCPQHVADAMYAALRCVVSSPYGSRAFCDAIIASQVALALAEKYQRKKPAGRHSPGRLVLAEGVIRYTSTAHP